MKLLALSDLHLSQKIADQILAEVDQADALLIAGNFAQKGQGLNDYLKVFSKISTPTVIVPGNHESLNALQAACENWSSVHILHGNAVDIAGQCFFGLGYEFPRRCFEGWNHYLDEAEAGALLEACPKAAVLLTHVPPFGVGDLQRNGAHEGSRVLRRFLETRPIKLHLCGHIHNAWGQGGWINGCWSQNLGPRLSWFEI